MRAWTVPELPTLPPAADGLPPISLHDTASGEVRPVGPETGTARLYVCGITPYDATHMGHANTYVAFDLLNRAWRDRGLAVRYVQNVTDVDDPLLERARATGVDWRDLAEQQTELFRTDMTALNVLPPADYIGAVESIDLVTELLQRFTDEQVYQASEGPADWYFAVHSDPEFGQISHLDERQALATFAERGGDPERAGKRHPLDCLVWQQARPEEPSWPSPFGEGRPGWHIECAAIAERYLGTEFDVQGGGSDLAFPHHEMSAAEAFVATGKRFARAYVHAGMVGLDGEKMSKSKGNLVLVSRLRAAGVDPMAIRLVLLGNHYRSDWSWTDGQLAEATARLATWRQAVALEVALPATEVLAEVRRALADDLDAPAALRAIDDWAAASIDADGDDTEAPGQVAELADALLGVRLRREPVAQPESR
ncbi:cysteine--1-D-myo-inosityl 2-amino-2-deoxy-alpha-D-glucopyranoside ligase [Enemella evansiae]|uniref:cysteine--1-D-myo-inosityl 2-amino-2-deoxy-alpha-D-glucopyranoside ligase n=1 Tax=Enemella evansiae TaxID=2016499 RepID=UPI000B967528|nr:cysteine--1-D-myo-inosityl 2-amino-2-deoxy-alpha-D-glucopyranoside ligase [Enemella evansiae]OYO20211.1 cysteine--1-D-myo-inosityl 2-amino-2-deoxy-alpha-D-glucopyranoside ligase [Enemella evansiae]